MTRWRGRSVVAKVALAMTCVMLNGEALLMPGALRSDARRRAASLGMWPRRSVRLSAVDSQDELASIRKMRLSEIQGELRERGVRYDDCFEKEELVRRLAESRASGGGGGVGAGSKKSRSAAAGSGPAPDVRSKAQSMRLSELTAALKSMGVTTRGMFEKSELVDAYVKAIAQGKTPDGDDDDYDGEVQELKTTKMAREGPAQQPGSPFGGAGGSPFGGAGSPFGGGGGMPGGMPGGIDIGSILGGLGGMGGMGGMGGNPFGGGMPGGDNANLQQLIQKAMGNPKVMAAIQKASQNPRMMAAVQDVMKNGPGAVNKYANDPEIRDLLKELQGIL